MDTLQRDEALRLLDASGFVCSRDERDNMEVAGFGLGCPRQEGAQILTLASTDRLALKVIVLLPNQTEPEHRHVSHGGHDAKQEILRVISGEMDVYLEGTGNTAEDDIPVDSRAYYTCRHKVHLAPGEQVLIDPPAPHWFRAGAAGCVALCVSTAALDGTDQFTDPNVRR